MSKSVGEYVLKDKLGKGNFADVFLAYHKITKDKFAVKVVSKESFAEPKLLAGLESEIKIMKELRHPNLLQLIKYFTSEKNFYIVTEFCAGGDLSRFIRKRGQLSEDLAFNFLHQLTEGLNYLHEHQFIHRDLKPANVLLTDVSDQATLKIADFGFSRNLGESMLAQTRCGTPLYMAPEILEAREYDAKADVWSVGCIFFEMLVGRCPFTGVNEGDLLNNIRNNQLRLPNDRQLSRNSIEVLNKLLERQTSRRASTQQLLQITRQLSSLSLQKPQSADGDSAVENQKTFASPITVDPAAEELNSSAPPAAAGSASAPVSQSSIASAPSTPSTAVSIRPVTPSSVAGAAQATLSSTGTRLILQNASTPTSGKVLQPLQSEDDYELVEGARPHSGIPIFSPPSVSTTPTTVTHTPTTRSPASSMKSLKMPAVAEDMSSSKFDVQAEAEKLGDCVRALVQLADRVLRESSLSVLFSSSFMSRSTVDTQKNAVESAEESPEVGDSLALAIRLHTVALTILKSYLEHVERSGGDFGAQPTLQFFANELKSLFTVLLTRLQQLMSLSKNLVNSTSSLSGHQVNDVRLEKILLDEALSGERHGDIDDLLGKDDKSLRWFIYSRGLIWALQALSSNQHMSATVNSAQTQGFSNLVGTLDKKINKAKHRGLTSAVLML